MNMFDLMFLSCACVQDDEVYGITRLTRRIFPKNIANKYRAS